AIAPAAAPIATFWTSLPLGSSRILVTSADATLAVTGYVLPPHSIELMRNSITTGSLLFSLRLRFVTVMFTVAPAGIAAPFVPLVDPAVVAVTLSPIALVFVHTLEFDVRSIVVPVAISPIVVAGVFVPVAAGVETLVVGVGAGGLVFVFAFVAPFVDDVFEAGTLLIPVEGAVSVSCGLAALSRFAIARFAASAESLFSESVFADSLLQADNVRAAIARDAAVRRVYF